MTLTFDLESFSAVPTHMMNIYMPSFTEIPPLSTVTSRKIGVRPKGQRTDGKHNASRHPKNPTKPLQATSPRPQPK